MTPDDPTVDDLRREVHRGRRRFAASPLSRFARKMQQVIQDYLTARAQGVAREDGVKGIEEVLRAEWPKRTTVYPPTCDVCDDTGWRLVLCAAAARCGRRRCAEDNPSWTHVYVVHCDCAKGDAFGPTPAPTGADALAGVGKPKRKVTGFTRWGRP